MKKTFKILTVMAVFVCYCFGMGVASSDIADASATGIPKKYFGTYRFVKDENDNDYYYGLEKKFIFFITGETSSTFEGPYEGKGIVACSNLDPYSIVFDVNGVANQENFTFIYKRWAHFENGDFITKPKSIEIMGRMENDASYARISSKKYFIS